jgi:hypothetical protein
VSTRRKGWKGRHPVSDAERIERYVSVDAASGCWVWGGPRTELGYGVLWANTRPRSRKAHRVVYEIHRGPIPAGLELDHLCRNPSCVNPDHLEPVTHAENMRRSPLVGRCGGSKAALRSRRAA